MRRLAFVLATLLAAGCTEPAAPADPVPSAPVEEGFPGIQYDCPAGAQENAFATVCSRVDRPQERARSVGKVIASPLDPATFYAVAYEQNFTAAAEASAQTPAWRSLLLVSSDRGVSWQELPIPVAQTPEPGSDAAGVTDVVVRDLAFTSDGILHVAGAVTRNAVLTEAPANIFGFSPSASQHHVFHLATADGGVRWSGEAILGQTSDPRDVRIGGGKDVTVLWPTPEGLAFTVGGNGSWAPPGQGPSCREPSDLVETGAGLVVACSENGGASIHRIEGTPPRMGKIANLDIPSTPYLIGIALASSPDGRLGLLLGYDQSFLAASVDGGATWTEALPVTDGCGQACAGEAGSETAQGIAFDGRSNLHLVQSLVGQDEDGTYSTFTVHQVRQPDTLAVLWSHRIAKDPNMLEFLGEGGYSLGVGQFTGRQSIAFQGDDGVLFFNVPQDAGLTLPRVRGSG